MTPHEETGRRILLPDERELVIGQRTLIMGVLNVTPDSFSDGGLFLDSTKALEHGLRMATEGADIIDIGGESTRPGSDPFSVDEEIDRVIPVIETLSKRVSIPLSIDTYKAPVARKAIQAGASIVNDISALRFDPEMIGVVAAKRTPVVLMHIKGTPKDMQSNPHYDDVIKDIYQYLEERIAFAESRGVDRSNILVDPGIGFGKTWQHNLLILKHLHVFKKLEKPILIGTSRKSFIGKVLGADVGDRKDGTAATTTVSIMNGADIVRVHNVKQMARVVRMTDAIVR
jgi:dihydropteroate synthase